MKLKLKTVATTCVLLSSLLLTSCSGNENKNNNSTNSDNSENSENSENNENSDTNNNVTHVKASTMASSTLDCSTLSVNMEANAPAVTINSMVFCNSPIIEDYPMDPNDPEESTLSYEGGTVTVTMTIDGTTVIFDNVEYEYGVEKYANGNVEYDLSVGNYDQNTDATGEYNFSMGFTDNTQEGFWMIYSGGNTVNIPETVIMTITVNGNTYEGTFTGNTTKTFSK